MKSPFFQRFAGCKWRFWRRLWATWSGGNSPFRVSYISYTSPTDCWRGKPGDFNTKYEDQSNRESQNPKCGELLPAKSLHMGKQLACKMGTPKTKNGDYYGIDCNGHEMDVCKANPLATSWIYHTCWPVNKAKYSWCLIILCPSIIFY